MQLRKPYKMNVILASVVRTIYLCTINLRDCNMDTFVTQTDPDYSLVDKHTGEIQEWKRTRVVSVDEFIMFFFASMPDLFKLKGLQLKVLMCCWKHSTYNDVETEGNILYNNKLLKDYIRSCGLVITDGAIDVIIHNLCKQNIIIKKCKGAYMLNPQYFFKGKLADKSKLELRMVTNP